MGLTRIPPEMAGERKLVTIVFADISGFTALSERLDPEHLRDLINNCFNTLVPIIEKYGGVVDKFIGDLIMALFGAPTAHENDAERALRAALEMMQELSVFNTRYKTDLGMHIGINSGLVVAGGLGSEGRQHYSVMGDTVNLASRLEDASENGQILVGQNTFNLTAPLFDFETLAPIRVKGKAETVQVYSLFGLKIVSGLNPGITRLLSPIIGRDAELIVLRTIVQDLVSGKGKVIAISGEPGLGKSRLIAELRRVAETDLPGIQWAEGHTQSYTEGMSYWIVKSMLDNLMGINPEMSPAEAGHKLWSKISALSGIQATEVFPYLARLREIPLDPEMEEHIRYLLPEALPGRMQRSFSDLVRAMSRERPVVMVWEDLHWADPSSMNLLETLLPLADEAAVILLITFRPDEGLVEGWHKRFKAEQGGEKYLVIELSPLSPNDSAGLIENLSEIQDLPSATRQMILDRAEGNPFFLEELHSSIIEARYVPAEGNLAVTAGDKWNLNVPDTLQGVIAARIDRLPPEDKRTLQTASVFGRVFQQLVLEKVLDHDQADVNLDTALADLQYKELIRWHGEWEYIFKHAVTQEVTYNSLLISRRKELHRLGAGVIEALYPGQLAELSATLAYHYARAEAPVKAIHYLIQAADRARSTYSNTEAIAFYQAALEQAGRLRQEERPDHMNEQIVHMHEGLGDVFALTGRNEDARDAYRDALALVPGKERVWRSKLNREIGKTWIAQRFPTEAQAAYDQAGAELGAVDGEPKSTWQEASLEIALDRLDAYYFSQSSIDEMEALAMSIAPTVIQYGTALQRAKFYSGLLSVAMLRNRYLITDETLEYGRSAQKWSNETDDRKLIVRTGFQVGFCHMLCGEYEDAEAELQAALAMAEQIGDRENLVMILAWLTVTYRRSGELEKARDFAGRSQEVASTSKVPVYIGIAMANQAWLAWLDGNLEEAQVKARAAIELFEHHRTVVFFAEWLMNSPLMDIALKQDNDAEAIQYARKLIHPGHMRMDKTLEEVLGQAVKAWDGGKGKKVHAMLEDAVILMRETGWM